jgi:putative CGCGG family rSAM target protein
VTETVHDNSWSANLEKEHHAENRDLVVEQAFDAVDHTTAGNHVNLVSHGAHGHPEEYLIDELQTEYGADVDVDFVDRCGCGGYVTRVHVLES